MKKIIKFAFGVLALSLILSPILASATTIDDSLDLGIADLENTGQVYVEWIVGILLLLFCVSFVVGNLRIVILRYKFFKFIKNNSIVIDSEGKETFEKYRKSFRFYHIGFYFGIIPLVVLIGKFALVMDFDGLTWWISLVLVIVSIILYRRGLSKQITLFQELTKYKLESKSPQLDNEDALFNQLKEFERKLLLYGRFAYWGLLLIVLIVIAFAYIDFANLDIFGGGEVPGA